MKAGIVLMAVSGIASAAAAQTVTLNIVASKTVIDITTTSMITLSVYASADFGTHISGGGFSLTAEGLTESVVGMDAAAESWGALGESDNGYGGDGNYTGLVFGQLIAPPFFPPAPESSFIDGDVLVATIVVDFHSLIGVGFTWGVLEWTLAANPVGGGVILQIFDAADNSLTDVTVGNFGSVSIIVPSPSALAVFGLGGLVAGRRRR